MWATLLLNGALLLAQAAPEETPAPAAPTPPDRWLLMKVLQGTFYGWLLDSHQVSISGWTEGACTASSNRYDQLPLGFNYRANEFLLQQNWLRIERPVDPTKTTPTFGFRSDTILPGTDYRFTVARGLFSGQLTANDGEPNTYGFDPIAFYAEGYFPSVVRGLDVKLGHFAAQIGVEANDAPSNALASHSYTFIYNPFTHTGVLAQLKLNDAWSVMACLVTGNDVFIDPASEPTFMGNVKWAPPSGRDSVSVAVILGSGRFNQQEQTNNLHVFDFIWTHRFNPRLNYTFHTAFSYQADVPDEGFIWSLGVVNYLTCDFTSRLSSTARLELFNDTQGQRTGFAGLYTALTAGLTFKPCRSVILRPEVRYDHNSDSRPFEGKHGLFTATMDAIVRW